LEFRRTKFKQYSSRLNKPGIPVKKRKEQVSDYQLQKKIIDLMGGELKVKSILGKGTTFTVVLTLKESENIIASKTEEMKQIIGYRGERKTILIADDNQNNSDILEGMLSPIGFSLIIVDDGEKAVSKTLENKPDLVLMDMIMPNMDGFEAIQKIRANDEFMDLPIIALSASVLKHEQESTLTVGSNDFLAKPFKIESLLDKIQFYLNLEWIYKKMLNEKKEFLKNNVVNNVDEDELPDKQFLETIKNLTLEGDFGGIITKLDELKERGNQYNRFIDRIKKFADDFDEDGIIEFIDGIE
jgi:CheY-like chemotaxis protein